MARPRQALHDLLTALVTPAKVHFQPPETVKLDYPCVIYTKDDVDVQHADNIPVRSTVSYQVTVIDPDPDSIIAAKIAGLPMSRFSQRFQADYLNHEVYTLFF